MYSATGEEYPRYLRIGLFPFQLRPHSFARRFAPNSDDNASFSTDDREKTNWILDVFVAQ